jgi:hypothetical protein
VISSSCTSGACVQVTPLPDGGRCLRDTEDPRGGCIHTTAESWRAFVAGVKAGQFDLEDMAAEDAVGVPAADPQPVDEVWLDEVASVRSRESPTLRDWYDLSEEEAEAFLGALDAQEGPFPGPQDAHRGPNPAGGYVGTPEGRLGDLRTCSHPRRVIRPSEGGLAASCPDCPAYAWDINGAPGLQPWVFGPEEP